jgi:CRP-like cAMP-binding protein
VLSRSLIVRVDIEVLAAGGFALEGRGSGVERGFLLAQLADVRIRSLLGQLLGLTLALAGQRLALLRVLLTFAQSGSQCVLCHAAIIATAANPHAASGERSRSMAVETVHLLEIEPDLGRFLSHEDRAEAAQLAVPVRRVSRGALDLGQVLVRSDDFGVLVLSGMALERMHLAGHLTMKLFGPGDLVPRVGEPGSMLISKSGLSASDGTRLAVLGHEVLVAVRRWPGIAAALHLRMGEQAERFAVQLAICQLPRVEERLLALFWWLAEAWGRVTSVGTVVPLAMTHDVLGALVGARRPTITLALGELVERGAIVRQDQGWLLLEPPPQTSREVTGIDDPALIESKGSNWQGGRDENEADAAMAAAHEALLETVSRLREQHLASTEAVRERLREVRESRERIVQQRRGRDRASSRPAPSSESRPPHPVHHGPAAEE